MIERDKEILGAEVIGYCMNKARTINEIARKIYKNNRLPSIAKVYQVAEILVGHGVLSVKCNDRQIRFQVNGGYFEK